MTTPNKITLVRIALIPLFAMMAIYYGQSVAAGQPQTWMWALTLIFFISAAASDGIDGYIARRFNQRSRLGAILDPIADKGLLLTAIITLSFCNWTYEFPLWFAVIVITRDLVIVIGCAIVQLFVGHLDVKPSWMGKVATVFQMIAVAIALLLPCVHWISPGATISRDTIWLNIPVLLASLFTFISGIGYVADGIHQLHAGDHAN